MCRRCSPPCSVRRRVAASAQTATVSGDILAVAAISHRLLFGPARARRIRSRARDDLAVDRRAEACRARSRSAASDIAFDKVTAIDRRRQGIGQCEVRERPERHDIARQRGARAGGCDCRDPRRCANAGHRKTVRRTCVRKHGIVAGRAGGGIARRWPCLARQWQDRWSRREGHRCCSPCRRARPSGDAGACHRDCHQGARCRHACGAGRERAG